MPLNLSQDPAIEGTLRELKIKGYPLFCAIFRNPRQKEHLTQAFLDSYILMAKPKEWAELVLRRLLDHEFYQGKGNVNMPR